MTTRAKTAAKKPTLDPNLLEPNDRRIYDKDTTYYFRYIHKIKPCKKPRHLHDHFHSTCPYWKRPAERRRCPIQFEYCNEPCVHVNPTRQQHYTFWGDPSSCPIGDKCPYAHNTLEAWGHPFQFRTKKCAQYDRGNCPFGVHCVKAHGVQNLTNAGQIRQELADKRRAHKKKPSGSKVVRASNAKVVIAKTRPSVVKNGIGPHKKNQLKTAPQYANGTGVPTNPGAPHQNGLVAGAPPYDVGAPPHQTKPPPGIPPPGIAPKNVHFPTNFSSGASQVPTDGTSHAQGVITSLRESIEALKTKNARLKMDVTNFNNPQVFNQKWKKIVATVLESRPPLDPDPNRDLKLKIEIQRRETQQMQPKTMCKLCGKSVLEKMMSPCGHVCCGACETRFIKRDHTGQFKCPFRQCRKRVDSVRTIYF